jgi:hypothetical protein
MQNHFFLLSSTHESTAGTALKTTAHCASQQGKSGCFHVPIRIVPYACAYLFYAPEVDYELIISNKLKGLG